MEEMVHGYLLNLQEAMRKAEAAGNDDCPVKIKLVAPPAYVLNTQTLDKVTTVCMFLVQQLEKLLSYSFGHICYLFVFI